MKQKLRIVFCLAALLGGAGWLKAQQAPTSIQYVWNGATINLQSRRGVPISNVTNSPPGSDGLMPTVLATGGPVVPDTGQFQSLLSFGGVTGVPKNNLSVLQKQLLLDPVSSGNVPFSFAVVQAMLLPYVRWVDNNNVTNTHRSAPIQIGTPL
jgi:hypothetical protein